MATDIYLTNTNINSGNAVYLRGASVKYSWKNLTRTTPLTNQFTLSESQITGFENPRIIISGFIDTNSTDTDVITQELLIQFAKIQYDATTANSIYLTIESGTKPTYLKNADLDGNSIKVIIEDFNIDFSASDSNEGHLWRYTLTLVETA